MIVNEKSNVLYFDEESKANTKVPENLIHCNNVLYLDKNSIVNIDNNLYYYKNAFDYDIIIELIGKYYSNILNIDCADYKIGISNNKKYCISKLFYDDNYKYFYPIELGYNMSFSKYKEFDNDKVNCNYNLPDNLELNKQILKLIAIDLRMGQIDRSCSNIILKQDKKKNTSLAPLYDFSCSYMINNSNDYYIYSTYNNDFIEILRNKNSINYLIEKEPILLDYITKLLDIDILDVLKHIEEENNIIITDDEKNYFNDRDFYNKKILKRK